MIQEKKLIFLFPWVDYLDVHLKKDTGLFPVYLAQEYKINTEIVFMDNPAGCNKTMHRGVQINRLENTIRIFKQLKRYQYIKRIRFSVFYLMYLKKNVKTMTHLTLFHINRFTFLLVRYAKYLNPEIKIWIKADAVKLCKKAEMYLRKMLKFVFFISVENLDLFHNLLTNKYSKDKVCYVPNGIDDAESIPDNVKRSNTIITVARLFSFQKNTELLLDILATVELKDWKIKLIGPIENEEKFREYIDHFMLEHPLLREKIIFTGNISDNSLLINEYLSAKVLICTSRWESFNISLVEAASLGSYIVSTDVGCIRDLLIDTQYGYVCPNSSYQSQNYEQNKKDISKHLQMIIDGKIDLEVERQRQIKYCKKNFSMSSIVQKECFKKWLI